MEKIVQCIPNFSEGRDKTKIEFIMDSLRNAEGIKLLDYSSDEDHNRTVVTFIGAPENVEKALLNLAQRVYENIDMRVHQGEHPRMGALDVVPFVPIRDIDMKECIELSKKIGKEIGEKYEIPVYLYEESATTSTRQNLADIRKGEYEGFFNKIKDNNWKPDYGPWKVNEKGGCIAIGARMPLIAFNVNLDTNNLEVANNIAKVVRSIGGGLRFVKAMGVELKDRGIVQVSMNLVNYEKTAIYRALEMVKMEAKRYGINVVGSEIVGLVPMEALVEASKYYLQLENFTSNQVLEKRIEL